MELIQNIPYLFLSNAGLKPRRGDNMVDKKMYNVK